MLRALGISMASLALVSCGNPAAEMDASATADYCAAMSALDFKAAESNASSIYVGTIGGIQVKALYKNDNDKVEMPKRGVLSVPTGTRIKIGDGDEALFVRARKNTLIARGEGGPVCGPVS